MDYCFSIEQDAPALSLIPLEKQALPGWLSGQEQKTRNWIQSCGFKADPGQWLALPDAEGHPQGVLIGVDPEADTWSLAAAAGKLPEGVYQLDCDWTRERRVAAAIGWGLGAYRFDRYRKSTPARSRLSLAGWPFQDVGRITHTVGAVQLVRDLINTPAEDMMPRHLATACEQLAARFGGEFQQIVGDKLIEQNYPSIHRVGRASVHEPRLLELRWGDPAHPLVSLVGKGVCFDSGGLDIKTSSGMRQMKKDMGGAAHVLGLAHLIMSQRLPVRLRVLIGAVENAISGNAFRPGDVITTRQGLTVEVDNTDAEGRLVLCDLLTEACTEKPDLLLNFATLTGAARVAVGTEIAAFFTDDELLAADIMSQGRAADDPCWHLPLHPGYRALLDSDIADMANSGSSPFAGAITAALFLQAFVPTEQAWAHFDIMAWNNRARPGRPKGGEAMGLRACFALLERRYGAPSSSR